MSLRKCGSIDNFRQLDEPSPITSSVAQTFFGRQQADILFLASCSHLRNRKMFAAGSCTARTIEVYPLLFSNYRIFQGRLYARQWPLIFWTPGSAETKLVETSNPPSF